MTQNRLTGFEGRAPSGSLPADDPGETTTERQGPETVEEVVDATRDTMDPSLGDVDHAVVARRRRVLKVVGALSLAGFAGAFAVPLKDLDMSGLAGLTGAGIAGQRLVYAHHEPDESAIGGHEHDADLFVHIDDFEGPNALDAVLAYPEHLVGDATAAVLLHRLDPTEIEPPTDLSRTVDGFVAYGAGCPHCGTVLRWSEGAGDAGRGMDVCPLHGCEFDPYRGGEVVRGPAEEGLTQVGVAVNDDGVLELTAETRDWNQ